jgi:hypothetical protein
MGKQYLVLRAFRSFGKFLHKGTIVEESAIRSPRLRMAEGKITIAVSSLEVPAESTTEAMALQGTSKGKKLKLRR